MADASDAAKTRAEELGVNIEEVEGTGQDGRVKVSDVEAFAEAQGSEVGEQPAEESPAEERFLVRLNPDTYLRGYDFGDGFGVASAGRYLLTESQYKKYSDKHNGLRVIVKA